MHFAIIKVKVDQIRLFSKTTDLLSPFSQTTILTHSICVIESWGRERKLFDGSDGVCFACE